MGEFFYETAGLGLDSEGTLFLKAEEGRRPLGPVEDASYRIPDRLQDEFEEVLDVWRASSTRDQLVRETLSDFYANLI